MPIGTARKCGRSLFFSRISRAEQEPTASKNIPGISADRRERRPRSGRHSKTTFDLINLGTYARYGLMTSRGNDGEEQRPR